MKRCYGSPGREWLRPDNFANEPVYCEAPHNPDDILHSGSDDEAYNSPAERQARCEAQAQRFLDGKPVFLLSASLRGPFDRESGWVNPWRSKSTSTKKSAKRKRPSAPKRIVEQQKSSGIFESSSCHQEAPESIPVLPQAACNTPQYMDGQTFHRIWDWRNQVVAESDVPSSPSQQASQTLPTSADSRRATQQTIRRRSGMTVDTLNGGLRSSAPYTPVLVDKVAKRDTSRFSARDDEKAASSSHLKVYHVDSNHAIPSQDFLSTDALPVAAEIIRRLSPPAPRIPEQSVLSVRTSQPPSSNPRAAKEGTSSAMAFATHVPSNKENLEERNATPEGRPLRAAASSAHLKTPASARTDGSFRYRRKDVRNKGSIAARNMGLVSGSALKLEAERSVSSSQMPLERPLEDDETPRPLDTGGSSGDAETSPPEVAGQVHETVVKVEALGTPKVLPESKLSQQLLSVDNQAADESQSEGDGTMDTVSQIDGPTLVPSEETSGSERSGVSSFGHFSVEKQSQDMIGDGLGLPRRLLWPKRRRSGSGDPLPVFGLEPTHTRVPEPAIEKRRSLSPADPLCMGENAAHPAEESEVVQQAPQIVQSPTRADASVVVETIGVDPEPTGEEVAESETASEAEDEEMHEAAEVRVEAAPESGLEGEAQPEVQPQPTATEVQSPRTKVEGVPPPQNDEQVNDEAEAAQSTPPQVTQSPWVKEANVVPGASGTPIPLPIPSAKLVVAREAPDEAVSQSPWARGDSQLQAPDARLFNPLSSPNNSNVLPTTEATTHLQPPCDDDIDMCNSQLYPPHPSTPETKHSSLPTPDFTLSVKSFKDFMTPSPQKPAPKRRRISTSTSTGADDHLPSTQALLDAAISNPWTRPPTIKKPNKPKRSLKQQQQHEEQQPRPKKRVSWADAAADNAPSPLPSSTPTNTTTAITTTTTNPRKRPRTTSPPPSILLSTPQQLPGTSEKFGKHFAAVAAGGRGRRVVTTTTTTPLRQQQQQQQQYPKSGRVRLLPSASQQVCGSPGVEAMAEAFLRGDSHLPRQQQQRRQQQGGDGVEGVGVDVTMGATLGGDGVGGGGGEVVGQGVELGLEVEEGMEEGQREVEGGVEREQSDDGDDDEGEETYGTQEEVVLGEDLPVDEVSAVMENLDDFLGGNWDVDADLAKARAEQEREIRGSGFSFAGSSGLMDIGVWD